MKLKPCEVRPVNIVCPHITAPDLSGSIGDSAWEKASRLDCFVDNNGDPARAKTIAWVARDAGYLYLAVRCEERNTDALQRTGSPWHRGLYSRDHVSIYVNPEHDHVNFRRFTVGPYEQTEMARGSFRTAHRAGPGSQWFHGTDDARLHPMYVRYASAVTPGECWSFEIAIPFESLEAQPPGDGSVWGLNVARYTTWPVYQGPVAPSSFTAPIERAEEWSSIAAVPGRHRSDPLVYADLLFDTDPVHLLEADFGVPHFGVNSGQVRLKTSGPGKLTVTTRVRPAGGVRTIDEAREQLAELLEGGIGEAPLCWRTSHYDDTNILELSVSDSETGRVRWHGSYELGWESGSLPLVYLHCGESAEAVETPDPSDPDFLVTKAAYIASRQHRFHRRNTAQGAASDFTLESDDASVCFNLMDPSCLKDMAQYVYNSYDNDTDRLLGMMFFAGQAAMVRAHSAYDPKASDRLETLSLMRFGSGYCGHMARVLAVLLNCMHCEATGRTHCARLFGIGGHGLVFVEHRGDYAILDSKHMSLYYTLDNADLATLKEFREQPEIGRRAYPSQMPALMTFDRSHIPTHPLDSLSGLGLIWPQDAPTQ